MSTRPLASARAAAAIRQRLSHAALVHDVSRAPDPSAASRQARLDAIVVPASRGVSALRGAVGLSVELSVPLVALCSKATRADEAAALAGATPGCQATIVDLPSGYRPELLPGASTAPEFRRASAYRSSDLGLKRNIGLLLARLLGWNKILFLDDDIGDSSGRGGVGIGAKAARRLAAQLGSFQVAGMVCRDFPDNSVVCHARRLAGLPQDNFVSGAALGVNCSDQPLPFFPDIYNEDWFFFSRLAAGRDIARVGDAHQDAYDPYATLARAKQEEFGDLLAEGLYALFEGQPAEMPYAARLREADAAYWDCFIDARMTGLQQTSGYLASALDVDPQAGDQRLAAILSLEAAQEQLGLLDPDLCVDFLDAWREDLARWEHATQRIRGVSGSAAAFDVLQLEIGHSVSVPRVF